jgi:biopolymer transport protein ExbD
LVGRGRKALFAPESTPYLPSDEAQADMLTRVATSRTTGRARVRGAFALASVVLSACTHAPDTFEMTPVEADPSAVSSRQVVVSVGPKGELVWQGRNVTAEELGDLMQAAAMGSPRLLLVVAPASGEVRYEDVATVVNMARARGIETRIAPKIDTKE